MSSQEGANAIDADRDSQLSVGEGCDLGQGTLGMLEEKPSDGARVHRLERGSVVPVAVPVRGAYEGGNRRRLRKLDRPRRPPDDEAHETGGHADSTVGQKVGDEADEEALVPYEVEEGERRAYERTLLNAELRRLDAVLSDPSRELGGLSRGRVHTIQIGQHEQILDLLSQPIPAMRLATIATDTSLPSETGPASLLGSRSIWC